MRSAWILALACFAAAAATTLSVGVESDPYVDEDEGIPIVDDDYDDNALDRLLQSTQKRACIRRGGNCDHRVNDCCYNSSCRCNLWGSNCRCQRMGLFQKWG